MIRRTVGAILAVFITWQGMKYVIHNLLLLDLYIETANIWRPPQEFLINLMAVMVLVAAIAFVLVYALFFKEKNIKNGLLYGLIVGVGNGLSWGFGSYAVMPIPIALAWGWALSTMAESLVAGFITGLIVQEPAGNAGSTEMHKGGNR